MGGLNAADRLKTSGIDARKGTAITVAARDIWAPPKGHPLYHPRFGDPVDPEMRDDIAERGVEKPLKVRDDGIGEDGRRVLLLVDGGRRLCNTLAAEEMIGKAIYVPIVFFTGDDAAVLRERLRANSDPLKRPDAASILALTVRQYTALRPGAEPREIARELADVMPRGVGPAEVEALGRWNNLTAEARKRFDAGAPIGLLSAVLDAPRDAQVATLDRLIAAGVRTAKGATRKANAARDARDPWARRMSPRQLLAVADIVHKRVDTVLGRGIEVGLRLAAGKDIDDVLRGIPTTTAAAIREARAAKPKKTRAT